MPRGKSEAPEDPTESTKIIQAPSRPLFKDFINALQTTLEERKQKLSETKEHLVQAKENAGKLKGVVPTYRP